MGVYKFYVHAGGAFDAITTALFADANRNVLKHKLPREPKQMYGLAEELAEVWVHRALGLALEEARQRRERRLLAGGETRDENRAPGDRHSSWWLVSEIDKKLVLTSPGSRRQDSDASERGWSPPPETHASTASKR